MTFLKNTFAQSGPSHSGPVAHPFDLTKVALTSLALVTGSGCGQNSNSVREKIHARPEATPTEIVQNPEEWIGKEVTINAVPDVTSKTAWLKVGSSKYTEANLSLDIRYILTDDNDTRITMIDDRSFRVNNTWVNLDDPAAEYVLPTSTVVVSGVVKKFKGSDEVYLDYEMSLYNKEEPIKDSK